MKPAEFGLVALVLGLLFVLIWSVLVDPPIVGFYYLGIIAPALTFIARSLTAVLKSDDSKPASRG